MNMVMVPVVGVLAMNRPMNRPMNRRVARHAGKRTLQHETNHRHKREACGDSTCSRVQQANHETKDPVQVEL